MLNLCISADIFIPIIQNGLITVANIFSRILYLDFFGLKLASFY